MQHTVVIVSPQIFHNKLFHTFLKFAIVRQLCNLFGGMTEKSIVIHLKKIVPPYIYLQYLNYKLA
jgi:hypothetical protein